MKLIKVLQTVTKISKMDGEWRRRWCHYL